MSVLPRAVMKNETEGGGGGAQQEIPKFLLNVSSEYQRETASFTSISKKHLTLHSTPTDVTNENNFPTKLNSTCSQ